jgi:glycosyltransferase involved in cell wall biosynthesis
MIHTPPPNDGSDWQLPDFEVATFSESRHRIALVIPVINEGERIRGQLRRIQSANLPVDVIVADGGSTDGSLDPTFLREAGVVAVLVKTGEGKLSAQLRMAYAWCLRASYSGIVTIDGNGKDGIEAVIEMVRKLEDGYDYVQASRYLPGGGAENTPIERTIANRFIHAPLLSLAGRRWYTDTTNGFRAYSARFLLDPRVQPFRNVFQRYELLFYLTVRAGQIGMRIADVPAIRSYPKNTVTPTKIDSLAAKIEVLRQTVQAALGRYAPK